MDTLVIEPTRCSCHPETCPCFPYKIVMDNRVIGYGPKKQDLDELASLHEKSNAMKEALERIASWSLQAESRPDSTDIEATIVFRLIYEQAKLILGLEEDNDRP